MNDYVVIKGKFEPTGQKKDQARLGKEMIMH